MKRTLPDKVSWNELFWLINNATRLSVRLDEKNRNQKRLGRPMLRRTVEAHNQILRNLDAVLTAPGFVDFATANDCAPGDMALLRYATHPNCMGD